jgi:hypothetical protein
MRPSADAARSGAGPGSDPLKQRPLLILNDGASHRRESCVDLRPFVIQFLGLLRNKKFHEWIIERMPSAVRDSPFIPEANKT